ncbi:hypothetical protein [Streptomyces caniscabiei]|uniref:hypothetical protein n=1 Tax=Streptomyces caniscabiei TaxID=2746961 RepID=UPI000765D2A7|nr:hypothetical protein [Streptomyces caniscabiei]
MSHTHSLAEWASVLSGSVGVYGVFSAVWFLLVDARRSDFDPRPAVRRSAESGRLFPVWLTAIDAGHTASWVAASVAHELAPASVWVRHELYAAREMARDAAALLILLTTSPERATR